MQPEQEEAVKEPVAKEPVVDATQSQQNADITIAQQVSSEESDKEINWKKFRAQREKERQEAERLKKEKEETDRRIREKEQEAEALKAALDAILQPGMAPQEAQESDDDRIAKAVEKAIAQRDAKKAQERQKREAEEMPVRLQKQHPDFERVVNQESLDYLQYHHPEIATPYSHMPDSVEKWSLIYRAIKKVMPSSAQQVQARIEENAKKPGSLSSGVVKSQDSAPVYLDDARKQQNWERMQRIIKGIT